MNVRRVLAATLAIAATSMAAAPLHAQFGLSVSIGATSQVPPPPLPEYDQPEAPGDGYLWTPGYWAWDDQVADYYWVPGTWVMAPEPGLLWTPGYWAYDNGAYRFNDGYWGEHVGFYGGVNYGFGYFGTGYEGGYWSGNRFFYNTAINRINLAFVHNTYVRPMRPEWINRGPRYAFNGPGGYNVRPSRGEQNAFREHHFDATGFQRNQQSFARQDRGQFNNFNHGAPPAAATPRPVQNANGFRQGAAPAQGAPTNPPNFTRGNGGFDRGNGGMNGGNRPGDNRSVDNRGAADYRFNGENRGDNRGNAPQTTDPRTNGGNGMNYNGGNYNGNGGRNGFNGQQPGRPNQPGQQGNPRGNSNFQPGDGRFRPQTANPPRMPLPQDGNRDNNGNRDNGGNRYNGGQNGQAQQPRQFQMTQPQPAQQPMQQRPAQQQPMQQQPTQQRPAQPMQQPVQQQRQAQPAPANNGGAMRDQRGPANANFRPR